MKAVLVIDEMPKSCDDCTLIYPDKYNDIWCCTVCDCVVEENVTDGTLFKWCPLKPLPRKMKHEDEIDYEYGYIDGRNDCIDEIMGETK